jgi:hypothetical protein
MKKIDVIGAGNVDIPYPNTVATRLIGQKQNNINRTSAKSPI